MKKALPRPIAAAIFLAIVATGAAGAIGGWTTGNDWRRRPEPYRLGYISGTMDLLKVIASLDATNGIRFQVQASGLLKCLETRPSVNLGQIQAVVGRFHSQHPEAWDQNMAVLVVGALREFCPPKR